MIKLKYSEVTGSQLLQTLHKIGNAPINPRETFKIRKIAKLLKAVMKHSSEISVRFQSDILPHFAKKREDGTYIDREAQQGRPFDILPEKEGEYKAALDKYNEQEIEIDLEKLNWSDIAHAGLPPLAVLHLEGIFNEASLDDVLAAEDAGPGPGIPRDVSYPQPTTPLRSM